MGRTGSRPLGWDARFGARSVSEGILSTASPDDPPVRFPDGGARLPEAVLWDMDGTLVDTEPYWIDVEYALVAEHGGTWSREHALNLVGNDLLVSGAYIREHGGVDLEPAEIVERLLDGVVERIVEQVPWRPGAVELLAHLRGSGIPCGLVTMSYERFVAPVLAALPEETFTAVVTGDAVTAGKPHAEPYLTAAALLGGVSLTGGRGTPVGLLGGMIAVALLAEIATVAALPTYVAQLFYAHLLAVIVVVDAPDLHNALVRLRTGLRSRSAGDPAGPAIQEAS